MLSFAFSDAPDTCPEGYSWDGHQCVLECPPGQTIVAPGVCGTPIVQTPVTPAPSLFSNTGFIVAALASLAVSGAIVYFTMRE